MPYPLDRIVVKGYKSIRELDIKLNPLNVLIGANGVGKSNFISLFTLLNQMSESRLQEYVRRAGDADSLLYYGQKTTDEINIELHFGDNGYMCRLAPTVDGSLFFNEERCWFYYNQRDITYKVPLGNGHKETGLHEEAKRYPGRIAAHVVSAINSWRVYHFHDTSDTAKVKGRGPIDDNHRLRTDASNLAAFLYLLREKHQGYYRNIVDTVRMVAPFFGDFSLRPDPLKEGVIKLEWTEKGSDVYFDAHTLSDGTLRFMCMATLLMQPVLPSTILLDEPELGLHPYAITVLAGLLRSVATKTQVIVSTQSVTLVNQFTPQDIIVVERETDQSAFRHLEGADMTDWLQDYGLGEMWEMNIFGGRPK